MILLTEAYQKLINTLSLGEKGYHKDYLRTVQLASIYRKLITGEELASLLIQFTPRETKEQFEQRVRLTQSITPAIAEKIINPFNKVPRIDNVTKDIINEDKGKIEKLKTALDNFYGDDDLEKYLENRLINLIFTDPNAFIVVEFDEFNPETETAKPFPLEIKSKDVINYEYKNNKLEWLLIRLPHIYTEDISGTKKKKEGYEYRIYTGEWVIQLKQVDRNLKGIEANKINIEEIENDTRIRIGNNTYELFKFNPKAQEVQAVRVGYKLDIQTEGRLFVSPLHPALSRFMKSLKAVSEFDLTQTTHVFPQKLQYVEACKGTNTNPCNQGLDINGNKCSVCQGTGVLLHTTATDTLTLPLPRDKEDMLDLDKLLVYKTPPVDLIRFQKEYLDELEQKAMTDVFVSESLARITGTMTATEKIIDMESVYDTLLPFANKYSSIYKKLAKLVATFTDSIEGTTIIHKFPKDFKLKSVNALLDDLKQAQESNAPEFLKVQISNDIANKVLANNPLELKKYYIKQEHIPFAGKSAIEIQIILNSSTTPIKDKILYSNFERIITEIELEQLNKAKDFYSMPYDVRNELIQAKLEEIITEIETDKKKETANLIDFSGEI